MRLAWPQDARRSPSALHGLRLAQAGLHHGRQTSQAVARPLSLRPGRGQAPHPLEGQQGVQTHAEVVAEAPLQDDIQGPAPLWPLKGRGERETFRWQDVVCV